MGSPTSASAPVAGRATEVPNADAPAGIGSGVPPDQLPLAKLYPVTAPVPEPPVGSPTSAVVPSPERATDVPNAASVAGAVSDVPADHDPLAKVKTVASPVPESPPPGSPTIAVVPLADIATELPKSSAVSGGVSAVPDDHVAPLNVYTVAAPVGTLPGSPTMAVVPFAETASDVPNELAEAGRVSAVACGERRPVVAVDGCSTTARMSSLRDRPRAESSRSPTGRLHYRTRMIHPVGFAPTPRLQRPGLPFVVYVVTQPKPFPPVGSPTSAVEPSLDSATEVPYVSAPMAGLRGVAPDHVALFSV